MSAPICPPPLYTLRIDDPRRHVWQVSVTVEQPAATGQRFRLPVWIPGSYLVREYARHVMSVSAHCADGPVAVIKTDKQTWQAAPCSGPLHFELAVYAHDESVRGAWVDDRRAYFNGAALLPWVEGQETGPQRLRIERVEYIGDSCAAGWQVATAMTAEAVDADGFGTYTAADYDELIDHPVEIAAWQVVEFSACGTPHRIVLSGEHGCESGNTDLARLSTDVQRVCEWQIGLFGGKAPFARYDFLGLATRSGYGGLEHRASTSLIFQRDHLPRIRAHDDKGYRTLLGLFSHEYFHSWLVKRIKPVDFAPYDLTRENLTRQLWLFEGFTSYYDDLALLRAGVIDAATYLKLIAETISRVHGMPGHRVQTLEDASLDAWIKYYRPDENSPNATVSYYAKGALVALSLDLHLRRETAGRANAGQVSLDTVMQALWAQHASAPLHDGDFEALAEAVSGVELGGFFERALRSTEELPLHEQMPAFGVDWQWRVGESDDKADGVTLGARFDTKGAARIKTVLPGGPAQRAGLAPGDEVVALDGWRVDAATLPALLKTLAPGAAVALHSARDGRLRTAEIVPVAPEPDTCVLKLMDAADAATLTLRQGWLGA